MHHVGASILSSVNIKELITYNQKDYEEVSISLGMKPEKLLAIKSKLKENLVKAPLFNSIKFTKFRGTLSENI